MRKKAHAVFVSALFLVFSFLPGCERCEQRKGAPPAPRAGRAEVGRPAPESASGETRRTQEPVVAGAFYPADPSQLKKTIDLFLDQAAPQKPPGRPFGFMVPHAGYRFSGPVAAYVYKLIKESGVKRFVVMGPSHGVPYSGLYVMNKDYYRTPLGLVRLDRKKAEELVKKRPWISDDERLYGREHSIEVQLPFLQRVVGDGLIVTVLKLGRMTDEQVEDLAGLLLEVFPEEDVLFIASSDMAHGNYPPYRGSDEIGPVDMRTLGFIQAMDIKTIARGVRDRSTPLCGGLPVLTLMHMFKRKGGQRAYTLKYADSGDATGEHSRVVGYGAVAFYLPENRPASTPASRNNPGDTGLEQAGPFSLSREEKIELLKMARAFVEAAVKKEPLPEMEPRSENLKRVAAAFVTLKNRGQLRGCIGSIVATEPLYKCVQRRAVDAAIHDARFFWNPIRPEELPRLEIEISVLTPPRRIKSPEEVVVGRDGVLLTFGPYRGVFLPQVPVEQGWNREQYLSNLCRKAGVPDPECYRRSDAVLETFQALVFSESEFGL